MKNLVIVFALLATSSAQAQRPVDPSGHWKGTIDLPGNAMDFEIDVARNARGEFYGTATGGSDRVTLPLQKIALEVKSERAEEFHQTTPRSPLP